MGYGNWKDRYDKDKNTLLLDYKKYLIREERKSKFLGKAANK